MRRRAMCRASLRLLRQRVHAAERRDLVFGQRDPPLVELVDERSPPPQAGELEVEPRAIEQSRRAS